MNQWVDVTDTFSESRRHYRNTYLEICEVLNEEVEISLFLPWRMPTKYIFPLESCMELSMQRKRRHTKNGSR